MYICDAAGPVEKGSQDIYKDIQHLYKTNNNTHYVI